MHEPGRDHCVAHRYYRATCEECAEAYNAAYCAQPSPSRVLLRDLLKELRAIREEIRDQGEMLRDLIKEG